MAIYYYISNSSDGWRNLAVDRFFLTHLNEDDIMLYFYINKNAVIIGKSQNAWRECNIEAMERDNVQLVRRHTGGGAVFHDENNLNFSFIMGEKNYDVARQMSVICAMAESFGIKAELSGRNDILAEGKKFSGNAFAAIKNMRAHHGTILVNSDLGRLANYLNVSEKKMKAKGIKSVKSRVCNLCDFNSDITVGGVLKAIKKAFEAEYGIAEPYTISENDEALIAEAYKEQSSWEWRMGRTPQFDYSVEERFSFGEMQLLFSVKDGYVSDVNVYSDALDIEISDIVGKAVLGAPFRAGDIAALIASSCDKPEAAEIAKYMSEISF